MTNQTDGQLVPVPGDVQPDHRPEVTGRVPAEHSYGRPTTAPNQGERLLAPGLLANELKLGSRG